MSAMPIYGEEDDDFAYEDEHIELESENQEYDELDDHEFERQPALIRGEGKVPMGRVERTATEGHDRVLKDPVGTPQQQAPSPTAPPSQPATSPSITIPKSRRPREIRQPSRQAKPATGPKKRLAKANGRASSLSKSRTKPGAKKQAQPVQKKTSTKVLKKKPTKKALGHSKARSAARNRAVKPAARSNAPGAARKKRRSR